MSTCIITDLRYTSKIMSKKVEKPNQQFKITDQREKQNYVPFSHMQSLGVGPYLVLKTLEAQSSEISTLENSPENQ